MAIIHKIRCCYVTIKSIHGEEHYLVPSRDNTEALAQFSDRTKYAEVTAHGNFQLEPTFYDDATRFELCHDEKNHYYQPGTPGYDYLASEFQTITRSYEEDRKNHYNS